MDLKKKTFHLFYSSNGSGEPIPKQGLVFTSLHYKSLKTLWKKEKLLIMSNFSFSHSVFDRFLRTFCHFVSNLKLSANYFGLEESKIYRLGKG